MSLCYDKIKNSENIKQNKEDGTNNEYQLTLLGEKPSLAVPLYENTFHAIDEIALDSAESDHSSIPASVLPCKADEKKQKEPVYIEPEKVRMKFVKAPPVVDRNLVPGFTNSEVRVILVNRKEKKKTKNTPCMIFFVVKGQQYAIISHDQSKPSIKDIQPTMDDWNSVVYSQVSQFQHQEVVSKNPGLTVEKNQEDSPQQSKMKLNVISYCYICRNFDSKKIILLLYNYRSSNSYSIHYVNPSLPLVFCGLQVEGARRGFGYR